MEVILNYSPLPSESPFLFKNQRKSLTKSLLATVSLSNAKFGEVKNLANIPP
jgi:hypothetical protein